MTDILKQKIRRDLSRWSRKLLLCIGLESIGQGIMGKEAWSSVYTIFREEVHENAKLLDPEDFHIEQDQIFELPAFIPQQDEVDEDEDASETLTQHPLGSEDWIKCLPYWHILRQAFSETTTAEGNGIDSRIDPIFVRQWYTQHFNSLLLLHSITQQHQQKLQDEPDIIHNSNTFGTSLTISSRNPSTFVPQLRPKQEFPDPRSSDYFSVSKKIRTNSSLETNNETEDFDMKPLDLSQKHGMKKYNKDDNTSVRTLTSSCHSNPSVIRRESPSSLSKCSPRSGRAYTSQEMERALSDIQSGKLGTRRAAVVYGIPRSTLRNKVYKLTKNWGNSLLKKQVKEKSDSSTYKITSNRSSKMLSRKINGSESDDGDTEDINPQKTALKQWLKSQLAKPSTKGHELVQTKSKSFTVIECSEDGNGRSDSSDWSDEISQTSPIFSPNTESHRVLKKLRSFSPCSARHDTQLLYGTSTPEWTSSMSQIPTKVESFGNDYDLENGKMMDYEYEKKSRPKRGKYRNYDREALTKAVKAVQNGEMTVHRAGSFFGVPHSTLEYKVKERHLLRRPKRIVTGNLSNEKKSSPESSLSGSEPRSPRFQEDISSQLITKNGTEIQNDLLHEHKGTSPTHSLSRTQWELVDLSKNDSPD